jgi:hypothetical protein
MDLYTITDLSKIWIDTFFYEYEARAVQPGMTATFTLPYYPGKELTGKVAYVYPTVETDSRTVKVRFDFENPGLTLKPGMYADVFLAVAAGTGVVVPDSAVMDTGTRQIVYVDAGGGRFEPRAVQVGIRNSGRAQILTGLRAGESVVVQCNFLLDSESRLRAAIAGAVQAQTPQGAAAPPAAGPSSNSAGDGNGKILFYRNPMNAAVTSPVPLKDEMGLDYVPVYEGEATSPAGGAPK